MNLGRASGCSNTPNWTSNDVFDLQRAISMKISGRKWKYHGYAAKKEFEESPSQLYYSGSFFEKRKIYTGGRQNYVVG